MERFAAAAARALSDVDAAQVATAARAWRLAAGGLELIASPLLLVPRCGDLAALALFGVRLNALGVALLADAGAPDDVAGPATLALLLLVLLFARRRFRKKLTTVRKKTE